ncbi:GtrA family protein [Pedobacter nutrimenti]|uniref:Putative flippase GtrA n=1 Tax=Pedobacter nutrimenti TaxID=1241337 RepID=A0A318UG20_9SPHI|nr:GtrA family protein [Pedobacter nutrimenti]PYF73918.1 putative flippase GtrA [Pedobacter nutrimenti]
MRKAVLKFIDFFYPPFSRWLSPHTFRYIVSGATTASSGIVVYFIAYNLILHQQHVQVGGLLVTAPIAALAIESVITLFIGFVLNKYLVFTHSNLKGRIQLFRYATVVATNVLLNYGFLKILIEAFGFYPTVAKIITTGVLAICSYFLQKYFSFRVKKETEDILD